MDFNRTTLQYKRIHPNSIPPSIGSPDAAGLDLYCCETVRIKSHSVGLVNTGIAVVLPPQSYGRIADRSSVAQNRIVVVGGVIDADYRGEVRVMMRNDNSYPVTYLPGARVAQLIVERIYLVQLLEVKELPQTQRGAGGFGSTGV